jgi:hypothetical protein
VTAVALPTFLCLFTSESLRQDSCFAGLDRRWTDRTDEGPCEYVSYAIGTDKLGDRVPTVAAAIIVARPGDVAQAGVGAALCAWCDDLGRALLPVDLVAVDRAVEFYGWIGQHAPLMMRNFRQDGEVKANLPSWWRRRAEFYLAQPRNGQPDFRREESSTSTFNIEELKRFMDNRKAGKAQ